MITEPEQTNQEWLSDYTRIEAIETPKLRVISQREPEWLSTDPPADDLAPSSFDVRGQAPSTTWTYHAADGAPIGYVCRYDRDGKKQVLQWTYGRMEGSDTPDAWALKHFSKPRPLYNLHEAVARPDAQLVIVEGEKCADAASKALPNQVCMTWPGGAQAVKHAKWSDLADRGRKVAFLWPDADDPGRQAMTTAGEALYMMGYEVTMLDVEGRAPGWDVADAVAEGISITSFIKSAKRPFLPAREVNVLPPMPPEPPPADDDALRTSRWGVQQWITLGLEMVNSKPVPNTSNVSLVLENIRPGVIWYDEFLQKIMTLRSDGEGTREWTDADDIRMTIELQRTCAMLTVNKSIVRDGIVEHAYKDTRNELKDWLGSLQWDGVERINEFFVEVCGAKGSPYMSSVGRNFFISLVARAMRPGCKVDNMIVLEGAQGMQKSSVLEELGGRWYTIMRQAPTSKDFEITLQGKWLIEIAELDAFGRADLSAVKRTMTTRVDRYRSPYGVHAQDHERTSVFAGTVNPSEWNSDPTGARRFWPILCRLIDLARVRRERDQLFAEACAAFAAGESWWLVPWDEAKQQQDDRYSDDPWAEMVEFQTQGRVKITVGWLMETMGLTVIQQDKKAQMRIASILRHAGWIREVARDGDKVVRRWTRARAPSFLLRMAPDVSAAPPPEELPPVDGYDD